jgi:hypothetical protein
VRSGGRTRPSANNPLRNTLIATLNIPESLTDRPKGAVDIRLAWSKFDAIQAALRLYYHMKKDYTWTQALVSADDIVELFVSKTVFHRNYKKLFPRAQKFPALKAWLDASEDAPSDGDVWDNVKSVYTFVDLQRNLEGLEKREKKGKRKADDGNDERKSHKKFKKASRIV